jgi:S1-C subfamily serine protease
LLAGLILPVLGGCVAAEQVVHPLAQDRGRDRAIQRQVDAHAKTKVAGRPQLRPATLLVSASAPFLPTWRVPCPEPASTLTSTLTPSQLFKLVSPAVYAVMVLGPAKQQVVSQGSAVAVSSKEAITNCHVVANAKGITLVNAAAKHKAEVIAADPSKDRCYLRVQEGELVPVPGLRDYASLTVGEVVFTIGSPKGMVNTLSNGLLSGLRTSDDDAEYVQITAPISEGSSGGGVFDDRGNLIGVTTFMIRDSQNLNFAIAASQFWR